MDNSEAVDLDGVKFGGLMFLYQDDGYILFGGDM